MTRTEMPTVRLAGALFLLTGLASLQGAGFQTVRNWGEAQGLNLGFTAATAQTADGFLWFGTPSGLFRFDGYAFVRVDPRGPGMAMELSVSALLADRDGGLWIGSTAEGLYRFEKGAATTYRKERGLTNDRIKCLYQDADGVVWVGTDGGGAFHQDGDRFVPLHVNGRAPPTHPTAFAPEPGGGLRIGTHHDGIFQVSRDGDVQGVMVTPTVKALLRDRSGTVWIGTALGLAKIVEGKPERVPLRDANGRMDTNVFVIALAQDRWGALWIGTATGLVRLEGDRQEFFGPEQGLGNGFVTSVFADREGTVWVGTEVGDLHQIVRQKIRMRSPFPKGLPSITTLWMGRQGRLWAGGDQGLVALQDERTVWTPPPGSLAAREVFALGEDDRGRLWFAKRMGDWGIVEGDSVERVPTGHLWVAQRSAKFFLQTRHHGLLVGTAGGLLRVGADGSITNLPQLELSHKDVTCALEQDDGTLWVGTGYGLNRFRNGETVAYVDLQPRALEVVYSLIGDPDNTVWVASQKGLWRVRDGQFFAFLPKHGMPPAAGPLVEDGRGFLWIALGEKVARAALAGLNDVADGRASRVEVRTWGRTDGLRSDILADSCWGIRSPDGVLHFATDKGIADIDPGELRPNDVAPTPRIERLVVNGENRDWLRRDSGSEDDKTVVLPPGYNRLEVHFAALSYSAPDRVRFAWRLQGLSDDWEDTDGQRTAFFRGLRPGRYEFELNATNEAGVPGSRTARLHILALSPWWQTPGFRLGALGLACATLGGAYSLRVRRLKQLGDTRREYSRRLLERQEMERSRLAKELHDGLGQDLLILKNQLAMLERDLPPDRADLLRRAQELGGISQSVIDETRTVAHNLRPAELDRVGLTASMEAMLERVASSSDIEMVSRIENIEGALSKEGEVLVYRISQELVNNLLKHSQAQNALVSLARTDPQCVELMVSDDGRGFNLQAIRGEADAGRGLGLDSVAERVEMLGGSLRIESSPGTGTRCWIRVPVTAPSPSE